MAASSTLKASKDTPYLEKWNTRFGLSERVVIRNAGRFVDNTSLTALKNGVKVTSQYSLKSREK